MASTLLFRVTEPEAASTEFDRWITTAHPGRTPARDATVNLPGCLLSVSEWLAAFSGLALICIGL